MARDVKQVAHAHRRHVRGHRLGGGGNSSLSSARRASAPMNPVLPVHLESIAAHCPSKRHGGNTNGWDGQINGIAGRGRSASRGGRDAPAPMVLPWAHRDESRIAPLLPDQEKPACRGPGIIPYRSLAGSARTRTIAKEGSIGFSELQSRPVKGGFHPRGPAPGPRIGSSRKRRAGESRRKVRALPEPRRGSVRGTGPPRGRELARPAGTMRSRPA